MVQLFVQHTKIEDNLDNAKKYRYESTVDANRWTDYEYFRYS